MTTDCRLVTRFEVIVLLIFSYLSSEGLKYSKILFLIVDNKAKTGMVGILHVADVQTSCRANGIAGI